LAVGCRRRSPLEARLHLERIRYVFGIVRFRYQEFEAEFLSLID